MLLRKVIYTSSIPLFVAAVCWLVTSTTQLQVCVSDSLKGIHYLFVVKSQLFKDGFKPDSFKLDRFKRDRFKRDHLKWSHLKWTHFKHGDIVFIKDFHAEYIGQKNLSKRIIGLPGDKIVKGSKGIQIITKQLKNPESLNFPLLDKTKEGKPLTPLDVSSIPEGHVFVAGDHPRSFDSRYQEFGLVPVEKIWGKAVLAW